MWTNRPLFTYLQVDLSLFKIRGYLDLGLFKNKGSKCEVGQVGASQDVDIKFQGQTYQEFPIESRK